MDVQVRLTVGGSSRLWATACTTARGAGAAGLRGAVHCQSYGAWAVASWVNAQLTTLPSCVR